MISTKRLIYGTCKNINELLNKQKIESNRIEFKKGWNPASIYHSVCAFANDFDDLRGGYIVVGVDTDEATGVAIRPVNGIPTEMIDGILDSNRSQKFFSYPYQALEESVTNSLYHRDYREWEPVVITIEPQGITIQNVGGPDRSISAADISRCEVLVSKRYRNRRLGEYLKELDLTEGRSTGIPTIQNVLMNNGSPRANVVTDEERTFF